MRERSTCWQQASRARLRAFAPDLAERGRGRYGRHVEHYPDTLGESVDGIHLVAELPLTGVAGAMRTYVTLSIMADC